MFYLNVFFGDTIISNDTLFEVMSGNFYSYSRLKYIDLSDNRSWRVQFSQVIADCWVANLHLIPNEMSLEASPKIYYLSK